MRGSIRLVSLLTVVAASSCGGGAGGMDPDIDGAVQTTTDGGQVATGELLTVQAVGRTLTAMENEVEVCEVVDVDNDQPLKAHSFKLTIDPGVSHHAIVQLVMPSPTNPYSNGAVKPGQFVVVGGCSAPGDDSNPVLIGTQKPVLEYTLPPDVYFPIRAKQRFLFNYHYIKLDDQPFKPNVKLEIRHSDGDRTQQAGALFYNWTGFEAIQPGTTSTQSHTCSGFTSAMKVMTLNGHQHKMGTKFEAFVIKGAQEDKIYESNDWANPLYKLYEPLLEVAAGDQIKFTCTWTNTTGLAQKFGTAAANEMCILGGIVFPTNDLTVTCN